MVIIPRLHPFSGTNTKILQLLTNLQLKIKKRVLEFPTDFGELTSDGLIDATAMTGANSEADLRKIESIAAQEFSNKEPSPDNQIIVANGHLETPGATVEVEDISFQKRFVVMTNLTSLLVGLFFLQRDSTVLDMRQGGLNFQFPYFLSHATQTCRPYLLQY